MDDPCEFNLSTGSQHGKGGGGGQVRQTDVTSGADTVASCEDGAARLWPKECGCSQTLGNGSQLTARKKAATSALRSQGTEFCPHPDEQETGSALESEERNAAGPPDLRSLGFTLDFGATELYDTKCGLFSALKFRIVCQKNNRKLIHVPRQGAYSRL